MQQIPWTQFFHYFGLVGTLVIILAIAYSALVYRGKQGERYSVLNHFISELGEVGVSRAARVFNVGLTAGGIILLPFMLGLAAVLGSVLGWLGGAAGVVASLGVAAVGVFPMNDLTPHTRAAMTYFRSGLVMVLFFGLAILFQPAGNTAIPLAVNVLSLVAVVAYASFLLLTHKKEEGQEANNDALDPEAIPQRPRFWLVPAVEWAVFFSTILWMLGTALLIQR